MKRLLLLLFILILFMSTACAELKDDFFFHREGEQTYLYRISTEIVMSGDFLSMGNLGGELAVIITEDGDPMHGKIISESGDSLEILLDNCFMYRLTDDLTMVLYHLDNPNAYWGFEIHSVFYYEGKLYNCPYFPQNQNKEWLYRDGGPIRALSNIKGESFGYADIYGNYVTPFNFQSGGVFSEGLACVEDNEGKSGIIDETGEIVIRPDMETWIDIINPEYRYFSDGRLPVRGVNDRLGYIDKTGTLVIDSQFRQADLFSEGRALVANEAGKCYYIDTQGNRISDGEWDGGKPFSNGYAIVVNYVEGNKRNKKYGCIDINGNITVPVEFGYFSPANPQGTALTYVDDGASSGYEATRVIDLATGEFLTDDVWEVDTYDTDPFNNQWGVYVVYKEKKAGVIDARGNVLFPAIYDAIKITDNGNLMLYLNDREFCVMIP